MGITIIEAEVTERTEDTATLRLKAKFDVGEAKDMGLVLREGRDDPEAWKVNKFGKQLPVPPSVALALHEALDAQHPGIVEAEMERICG